MTGRIPLPKKRPIARYRIIKSRVMLQNLSRGRPVASVALTAYRIFSPRKVTADTASVSKLFDDEYSMKRQRPSTGAS